jgi:preprotein translocase subunit SecB
MSDTPGNGAADPQQQQPPIAINGQYIKDLSFESPNSPTILGEMQNLTEQPNINISVNISTAKLEGPDSSPNLYEVVLEMQAELKVAEKTGYIVELKYGGVFTLNVPEEHLTAVLMIECPRMLFPYARQILSDTTQSGGFMPLMLQPIDFAGMYHNRLANEANDLNAEVSKMSEEHKNN